MLASLEELVLRCRDDNSRSHIREAVRCYEAGAYRAAIVAVYVAVCFDLIEKLRSLAAAEDAEAGAQITSLERLQEKQRNNDPSAVRGLLQFERDLPRLFRDKFEFFGVIEYDEIDRLVVDRNKCAHPTFLSSEEPYHPSAEAARLHLRNALDLVLTQEPRQGKAALIALGDMVCSDRFPRNADEARKKLEASPLRNARDSLVRGFVDDAIFGSVNKGSPYYRKFAAIVAVEAVAAMRPKEANPRICANVAKLLERPEDEAITTGALISLRTPEVANALPDAARPALTDFVMNPKGTTKAITLDRALSIDWLKKQALTEIAKLELDGFEKVRVSPARPIVERAVQIILAVKSHKEATRVARELSPLMRFLDENQIRSILSAASDGSADLKGSYGFHDMLQSLASENPIGLSSIKSLLAEYGLDEPKWSDATGL